MRRGRESREEGGKRSKDVCIHFPRVNAISMYHKYIVKTKCLREREIFRAGGRNGESDGGKQNETRGVHTLTPHKEGGRDVLQRRSPHSKMRRDPKGGAGRGAPGRRGADLQLDEEGVADFQQDGLLVVDMLLLLQADDVRDAHDLEGEEALGGLVPHQVDAAEGARACGGQARTRLPAAASARRRPRAATRRQTPAGREGARRHTETTE